MPTPYIKKVANKHHISLKNTEEKWAKAKRIASQKGKGGNYAYVTGVFKDMTGESVLPTFKQFIMAEADVEASSGETLQLQPNVDDDDDLGNGDTAVDAPPTGDFDDNSELASGGPGGDFGEDFDLESDERFKEILHAAEAPGGGDEKAQGMVNRLRSMAQSASPEEVEHELQTTWERMFGGKGVHMSAPDDMHHMGGAAPAATAPTMGESLLASLISERWG